MNEHLFIPYHHAYYYVPFPLPTSFLLFFSLCPLQPPPLSPFLLSSLHLLPVLCFPSLALPLHPLLSIKKIIHSFIDHKLLLFIWLSFTLFFSFNHTHCITFFSGLCYYDRASTQFLSLFWQLAFYVYLTLSVKTNTFSFVTFQDFIFCNLFNFSF